MPYRSRKQTGRLSGRNQGDRKLDAAKKTGRVTQHPDSKPEEISLRQ